MKAFIRKIWDAIVKFICNIPYDKLLHAFVGALIAALFYIDFHMAVCIVPVVFAGFIKEFFDLWTTEKWDWWDFAATCAGGLLIQIMAIFG